MPEFAYRARDAQGAARTGVIEADNPSAAATRLAEAGYVPTAIEAKASGGLQMEIKIPGLTDRVKLKDVAIGARQLATMINAGLPLLRALSVLTDQTESKVLARIWGEVRTDVATGQSFADALKKHPKVFNDLFVSMVRAGEVGGLLDTVLLRIANTLEKQVELRNKVRSAMTYPVMVGAMVLLILVAILLFVVPTFKQLYADLGGTLPFPTRILLFISEQFRKLLPIVFALSIVGFFALRWYVRREPGRTQLDRLKLRLPIFGQLLRKVAMSRFARTLGVLVNAGVPILQSLEITQQTVQNRVVAKALEDVRTSVREGESLSKPLERHKVFPPMVVQMLAVGEETGAIDPMLEKVADFYDSEVESTVESLTSLIEPLLVAFLGGVVGSILVSLYLPMFRIINLIK